VVTTDFCTIERDAIVELVNNFHEGHIFTCVFYKRSTGEERVMNCRKGVTKHLAGGPPAYDPAAKKLIWVFDVQKRAYRSIAIEGILSLKMDGVTYVPKE
jgi:hypothetical protein